MTEILNEKENSGFTVVSFECGHIWTFKLLFERKQGETNIAVGINVIITIIIKLLYRQSKL